MVQRNSCHTVGLSENIKELLMLTLRHKVLKTLLVMQFLIRAIPFGTMVAVSCICLFVILPLTLVGSVLGRNLAGKRQNRQ